MSKNWKIDDIKSGHCLMRIGDKYDPIHGTGFDFQPVDFSYVDYWIIDRRESDRLKRLVPLVKGSKEFIIEYLKNVGDFDKYGLYVYGTGANREFRSYDIADYDDNGNVIGYKEQYKGMADKDFKFTIPKYNDNTKT